MKNRLKELRIEKGLTLADLFGVDDLKLYIEILKIVAVFLQEKVVED